MSRLPKIDVSSPQKFKQSLEKRAVGIEDSDFVSMHSQERGAKAPASGRWGMVVICVGVAKKNGVVAVRNTNDPDKATVLFSKREWKTFTDGIKAGAFD